MVYGTAAKAFKLSLQNIFLEMTRIWPQNQKPPEAVGRARWKGGKERGSRWFDTVSPRSARPPPFSRPLRIWCLVGRGRRRQRQRREEGGGSAVAGCTASIAERTNQQLGSGGIWGASSPMEKQLLSNVVLRALQGPGIPNYFSFF